MDKRGQGLSINAIILIVLGVIVVVLLILGFVRGWDKLAPWISSDNVGTIITSCQTACVTNDIYGYCIDDSRELKSGDDKFSKVTCHVLSLDDNLKKYGVAPCPSVNCKSVVACADTSTPPVKLGYTDKTGTHQQLTIGTRGGKTGTALSPDYCKTP